MYSWIRSLVVALGILLASSASGAEEHNPIPSRKGNLDLSLGAGITYNTPARPLIEIEFDYFAWHHVSVGLAFDTYIRSESIFVLRPMLRYHFDVPSLPEFVPYIGGGIGGGVDTRGKLTADILVPNLGFKYKLTDTFYLGSDVGFHVLTNFSTYKVDFHFLFLVMHFVF